MNKLALGIIACSLLSGCAQQYVKEDRIGVWTPVVAEGFTALVANHDSYNGIAFGSYDAGGVEFAVVHDGALKPNAVDVDGKVYKHIVSDSENYGRIQRTILSVKDPKSYVEIVDKFYNNSEVTVNGYTYKTRGFKEALHKYIIEKQ